MGASENRQIKVTKICLAAAGTLIWLLSQSKPAISDDVMALADHLMELGSYDEAITEYKRFILFNPDSEYTGYALYKIGLAYRTDHDWQKAIDAFGTSILAAKDLEIADERRIILATTLIASGNYSLARLELLKVLGFSLNPSLRMKSLYYDGIAALYMYDWNAAIEAFGKFYSQKWPKVVKLILVKAQRSHKSARLAKYLSIVLPGLGQIYAGDWRDGLNALAINGINISLMANAVYRRDRSSTVLISSIFIRYYTGNIYRAQEDVIKYNESLDRQNALRVLELVRANEPF